MARVAILFGVLAIWFARATQSDATQIAYNVGISESDIEFGLPGDPVHLLRIHGTVKFDLDLQDIVSSSLVLSHTGPGILGTQRDYRMDSKPTYSFGRGSGWHWLATPTELRRIADSDNINYSDPTWEILVPGGSTVSQAEFSMGPLRPHVYFFFKNEFNNATDGHYVYLPGASGVGEPGMLFGTAVPEPSTLSLAVLGTLGLLTFARRSIRVKARS